MFVLPPGRELGTSLTSPDLLNPRLDGIGSRTAAPLPNVSNAMRSLF